MRGIRAFLTQPAKSLGDANGIEWFLVESGAKAACVDRGRPDSVFVYDPLRLDDHRRGDAASIP